MAWNEPGDNSKDPWGNRDKDKKSGGGPPDLDEALKKMQDKVNKFFGNKSGGGSGGSTGGGIPASAFIFLLVVAAAIYVVSGFYTLDEKEQAVVLRLGKFHSVEGAGLHWYPRGIDKVKVVEVTKVQEYEAGKGKLMLTEDESIVELPVTVQYNVRGTEDDIKSHYLSIESPKATLEHAAESVLRHVVGSTELEQVLSVGRQKMANEMKDRLQTYVDRYKTGYNIISVNIKKGKPPSGAVQEAFDDVIQAKEEKEQKKNEAQQQANKIIPVARGKAQQVIEIANGYREQVIAQAEGDAERFKQLLVEYQKAPKVTRERLYIDTLQEVMTNSSKVMVDVDQGNSMMYLPLDQIMKQSNKNRGSYSGTSSPSATQSSGSSTNLGRNGSRDNIRGNR